MGGAVETAPISRAGVDNDVDWEFEDIGTFSGSLSAFHPSSALSPAIVMLLNVSEACSGGFGISIA